MAVSFDTSGYAAILRLKEAYRFDVGTGLMRVYQYMTTLGTVTMLTLSGRSAFLAGSVASVVALSTFLISPRVSKLADERGQGAIVPVGTLITVCGLALMLGNVALGGPFALCYVAAVLMGFLPNAPAMARTRWTYLTQTGRLGPDFPGLKTVYSYEGVLEDIAFMVGPAMAITLSSSIAPIAGLSVGGVILVVGAYLLTTARDTEPDEAWRAQSRTESEEAAADDTISRRSMFVTSQAVRMLFFSMLLLGMLFGMFDVAVVGYTQSIGHPNLGSIIMSVTAVISAVAGFTFGMVHFSSPIWKQYVAAAALCGVAYGLQLLIGGTPSMLIVCLVSSPFYAPFIISANGMCERSVPHDRLTESMTWMNAGLPCGMAIGPTLGGLCIDTFGAVAGFWASGAAAVALAVLSLATIPLWRKQ